MSWPESCRTPSCSDTCASEAGRSAPTSSQPTKHHTKATNCSIPTMETGMEAALYEELTAMEETPSQHCVRNANTGVQHTCNLSLTM
mmetsp:Transcript_54237/g.129269  ORF Transcript_54237/g.129269 Transcript_54237/m.129269 type:complete len:87 (+) Transcript_54237:1484-1744(+)